MEKKGFLVKAILQKEYCYFISGNNKVDAISKMINKVSEGDDDFFELSSLDDSDFNISYIAIPECLAKSEDMAEAVILE